MLKQFAERLSTARKNKSKRRQQDMPRLEPLEDRVLLAVLPLGSMQGGTPNYFGPEPNWAYSLQPTVNPATGAITGGIRKFVDALAGLYVTASTQPGRDANLAAADNALGQYIPVAIPDTTTYPGSDYYEIELGEYTEQMHSDLNPTTLRGYRQVNTTDPYVSQFHYLGPMIVATQDRPVRIKFTNSLPIGAGGDLFLPVDTTVMGAGAGPNMIMPMHTHYHAGSPTVSIHAMEPHNLSVGSLVELAGFTPDAYNGEFRVAAVTSAKSFQITLNTDPGEEATVLGHAMEAYTDNRGTLHLHGGLTPWISDGTMHQWITPAGEFTNYDKGASAQNVPDMPDPGDGSMTFFWPNQQSSRLMFYHDHAFGITRLNVYGGEAAGYLLTDPVEEDLIDRGIIPAAEIPLIIQDKTFIDPTALLVTDPTWPLRVDDALSNLWMSHVYVPNQNPNTLDGVNPLGRWDYGPWIWPPFPVDNPVIEVPDGSLGFGMDGMPDVLPNLPDVSMGMESFMDTPLVNGTVYPYLEVDPQSYRFRILNASNDRFWNLQLVVADSTGYQVTDGNGDSWGTEVAMVNFDNLTAWPAGWPTPDLRDGGIPDPATLGPDIIQIGTEGGFLPNPVVFSNTPIGWDRDPKSMTVGNILEHNLFMGPAERADVIIDFSQFAGQTLILYNDAPAAVPANDPRYDYYTGNPDLTDEGGNVSTIPGYGPNTRTIMQIRVRDIAPADPFDMTALLNEFKTTTDPVTGDVIPGVFARGQDPIIVPQADYNDAYGVTDFPSGTTAYERIHSTSLTFNPLDLSTPALGDVVADAVTIVNNNKAIVEEFATDWGRMDGFLGVEVPFTNALNQTSLWFRIQDPVTEIVDNTTDPLMTPIGSLADGTQLWKITHNGVDTDAIHFHLFSVQVVNRVDWAGVVKAPEPNELGWKETVRMNPLEDIIVALRPTVSEQPFGVPDSVRLLDPTMPEGSTMGFQTFDANGDPVAVTNELYNFGWEYMWHCHLLSHEEMDMMRPIQLNVASALAAAPVLFYSPGTSEINLFWTDPTPVSDPATLGNPANEIGFRVERADVDAQGNPGIYLPIGSALANATTFTDTTLNPLLPYSYRVVVFNAAGDTASNAVLTAPLQTVAAPTALTATLQAGPQVSLAWTDNATDETGFVVQRSDNGGAFATIATPAANPGTGNVTYVDTTVLPGNTYAYQVCAVNGSLASAFSNTASVSLFPVPSAPTNLVAAVQAGPQVRLTWTDTATNETGFVVQRSDNGGAFTTIATPAALAGTGNVTYVDTTAQFGNAYAYQVCTVNGPVIASAYSNTATVILLAAPTGLTATLQAGPQASLTWMDNAANETGFVVQRSDNGAAFATIATPAASAGTGTVTYVDTTVQPANTYVYRVYAANGLFASALSNTATVIMPVAPAAPTNLVAALQATARTGPQIALTFRDNATNETGFVVERAVNGGAFAALATLPARNRTGNVTYTDLAVAAGNTYAYRVTAVNGVAPSAYSNTVTLAVPNAPAAPLNFTGIATVTGKNAARIDLSWTDNSTNETQFVIERATAINANGNLVNPTRFTVARRAAQSNAVGGAVTLTQKGLRRATTYYYRILAQNLYGGSVWVNLNPFPMTTP